jgi:cytoskeletal protein RodZ
MTIEKGSGKKGSPFFTIIAVILILVFVGLSGFLYWKNMGLAAQITTLNTTSEGVTASVASLTNQVAALNASDTALAAENAALTATNDDLMANLSFAAVPPLSSSTPSIETVSLTGKLTGSKSSFTLTTQYGVVALVSNVKDANIVTALTPLIGNTGVTLTGMHTPGSQYMTVTAVNGTSVQ